MKGERDRAAVTGYSTQQQGRKRTGQYSQLVLGGCAVVARLTQECRARDSLRDMGIGLVATD